MEKEVKTKAKNVRIRVSVLMKDNEGRICFVRHCKNGKRYWLLPGGGQDPYETAPQAAARELSEEINVSCKDFRLLFIRETMSEDEGRHIQFMVFEGIDPDFSNIKVGIDKRVEGFDFFSPAESEEKIIYPNMKDDIIKASKGLQPELYKELKWI